MHTFANLQNGVSITNDVNYGQPFRFQSLDLSLAFPCFSEAHIHILRRIQLPIAIHNSRSSTIAFVTQHRHPTIAILPQKSSRALVHDSPHPHRLVPIYVVPVRYVRCIFSASTNLSCQIPVVPCRFSGLAIGCLYADAQTWT